MPKIAKIISVTKTPFNGLKITIDGEDFPWHTSRSGITTNLRDDGFASISVEILCDELNITHQVPTSVRPL